MKIKALTLRSRGATVTAADHAALIGQLRSIQANQDRMIALLLEQLAEANLRIRYLMETIKYAPLSPIIGAPPSMPRSLFDLWAHGERERFLATLEEQAHASSPAHSSDDRAHTPEAAADGHHGKDRGSPAGPSSNVH